MSPLFGKPKQLKLLERRLTAARLSAAMLPRLPEANQRQFLENAPREIAGAVYQAVKAGHGAAAKALLDEAARQSPQAVDPESWRSLLELAFAQLPASARS